MRVEHDPAFCAGSALANVVPSRRFQGIEEQGVRYVAR